MVPILLLKNTGQGEAPGRSIIGEANAAEARALVEDGIPVARLPWSANPKSN
jgi:hypothetical protein